MEAFGTRTTSFVGGRPEQGAPSSPPPLSQPTSILTSPTSHQSPQQHQPPALVSDVATRDFKLQKQIGDILRDKNPVAKIMGTSDIMAVPESMLDLEHPTVFTRNAQDGSILRNKYVVKKSLGKVQRSKTDDEPHGNLALQQRIEMQKNTRASRIIKNTLYAQLETSQHMVKCAKRGVPDPYKNSHEFHPVSQKDNASTIAGGKDELRTPTANHNASSSHRAPTLLPPLTTESRGLTPQSALFSGTGGTNTLHDAMKRSIPEYREHISSPLPIKEGGQVGFSLVVDVASDDEGDKTQQVNEWVGAQAGMENPDDGDDSAPPQAAMQRKKSFFFTATDVAEDETEDDSDEKGTVAATHDSSGVGLEQSSSATTFRMAGSFAQHPYPSPTNTNVSKRVGGPSPSLPPISGHQQDRRRTSLVDSVGDHSSHRDRSSSVLGINRRANLNKRLSSAISESSDARMKQHEQLQRFKDEKTSVILSPNYTAKNPSTKEEEDPDEAVFSSIAKHNSYLMKNRKNSTEFYRTTQRRLDRTNQDRKAKYWKKFGALDLQKELPFHATAAAILHHVERIISRDERQTLKEEEYEKQTEWYAKVDDYCRTNYAHPKVYEMLDVAKQFNTKDPKPAHFTDCILPLLSNTDCLFDDVVSATIHIATIFQVSREEAISAIRKKAAGFIHNRAKRLDESLEIPELASSSSPQPQAGGKASGATSSGPTHLGGDLPGAGTRTRTQMTSLKLNPAALEKKSSSYATTTPQPSTTAVNTKKSPAASAAPTPHNLSHLPSTASLFAKDSTASPSNLSPTSSMYTSNPHNNTKGKKSASTSSGALLKSNSNNNAYVVTVSPSEQVLAAN